MNALKRFLLIMVILAAIGGLATSCSLFGRNVDATLTIEKLD